MLRTNHCKNYVLHAATLKKIILTCYCCSETYTAYFQTGLFLGRTITYSIVLGLFPRAFQDEIVLDQEKVIGKKRLEKVGLSFHRIFEVQDFISKDLFVAIKFWKFFYKFFYCYHIEWERNIFRNNVAFHVMLK